MTTTPTPAPPGRFADTTLRLCGETRFGSGVLGFTVLMVGRTLFAATIPEAIMLARSHTRALKVLSSLHGKICGAIIKKKNKKELCLDQIVHLGIKINQMIYLGKTISDKAE
ncbi:OLC1v1002828C1 [Oldenlandia corymbosa var. corymbosa]|uniref:OLC1v1002828C1 n=1 Tax=Oldenlandia corymbosa var. corymbosa TaxID=529605 RepID=A0AAV1DB29_OLDCO|nr:OLC1v1002828C1 [Oldenlandia corymbosa var. corymbosa]